MKCAVQKSGWHMVSALWLSRSSLDGSDSGDATVVALDHRRIQQVAGPMGLYDRLEGALDEIICGARGDGSRHRRYR